MPTAEPGDLFEGLLPKSRMAMNVALALRGTTGLDGWLHVYIPPEEGKPCEVMATTHSWSMAMSPDQFDPRKKR